MSDGQTDMMRELEKKEQVKKDKYPECEKLNKVKKEFHTLMSFLDWIPEKDIEFGKYYDTDEFLPLNINNEKLVYEYFGIDDNKIEQERVEMLKGLEK